MSFSFSPLTPLLALVHSHTLHYADDDDDDDDDDTHCDGAVVVSEAHYGVARVLPQDAALAQLGAVLRH